MVRFFSLLFRLFLLERGAKREKQPPLPDYFCFRRRSNYCAWKVFFALVLRWSQFECEKNRIPWKTFRILSLSLSYSVRKSALFFLCFFLSLLSRAREKNYSFQTPLLLLVFVVVLVVLLLKNTNTTTNWEREKEWRIFVSVFAFFFSGSFRALSLSLFTFFLFVRTRTTRTLDLK